MPERNSDIMEKRLSFIFHQSQEEFIVDNPIRRGPYPELTWTALVVGYFLGAVIAVSIGYSCLVLGFSIEGSELAAILGFGILRGLLKRTSIVENNINQTIASAINATSSGMMFSVPALFILNHTNFSPVSLVLGCIAGAVLGISFIIPLRKQMIDYERLAYPGGIAVATVLKAPGAGRKKVYLLLLGIGVSAGLHFFVQFYSFEQFDFGALLGFPEYMNSILYVSLLTLGVGFIAGKGGVIFVIGGYLCYWILAPLLDFQGLLPAATELADDETITGYLRTSVFKPVGIGMLVGGAVSGILLAFPLVISSIKTMQKAARTKSALSSEEMPIKILYLAIAGAVVVLFVMALYSTEEMSVGRAIPMALLGTLWIWMAGVILSECIGRTNWSPLSGMTLIAVTILVFISSGMSDSSTIIASVMVGAAVCVALSQATDLMMDLKTGYLVGASPKKQQIGQYLGSWLGPIITLVLIFVLHKAYGLGSEKLPAPQGKALASIIEGIIGGDIPIQKYIAGAGIGALLSASGIGGFGILVGLGFYLPFYVVITYSFGTLTRVITERKFGASFCDNTGIPVAAGFIVGEALMGVGFAISKVFEGVL